MPHSSSPSFAQKYRQQCAKHKVPPQRIVEAALTDLASAEGDHSRKTTKSSLSLSLAHMMLVDEDLTPLLPLLSSKKLTSLDLSHNQFTYAIVGQLEHWLPRQRHLRSLRIDHNPIMNLRRRDAEKLVRAVPPSLTNLDMVECGFSLTELHEVLGTRFEVSSVRGEPKQEKHVTSLLGTSNMANDAIVTFSSLPEQSSVNYSDGSRKDSQHDNYDTLRGFHFGSADSSSNSSFGQEGLESEIVDINLDKSEDEIAMFQPAASTDANYGSSSGPRWKLAQSPLSPTTVNMRFHAGGDSTLGGNQSGSSSSLGRFSSVNRQVSLEQALASPSRNQMARRESRSVRRRTTVYAESLADTELDSFVPTKEPKEQIWVEFLTQALQEHELFAHLDEEELRIAVDAMTKNQHTTGDILFYAQEEMEELESSSFISRLSRPQPLPQTRTGNVKSGLPPLPEQHQRTVKLDRYVDSFIVLASGYIALSPSQPSSNGFDCTSTTFGEAEGTSPMILHPGETLRSCLLLHPAAHTVTAICISPQTLLFTLDRRIYKFVLAASSRRRRQTYSGFLSSIELFKSLEQRELLQLADALRAVEFFPGQTLLTRGDAPKRFYLIFEGTVHVLGSCGELVAECGSGSCVGELEFIHEHAYVASVVAAGSTRVRTGTLNKRHFEMVMGPVKELLARRAEVVPAYEYYRTQRREMA